MQKRKKLQNKIPGTNFKHRKFSIFQKLLEAVKMLQTLALLIAPEDKSNKHQNQAAHSFHWQQNFSTDLIFRSEQI